MKSVDADIADEQPACFNENRRQIEFEAQEE